MAAIHPNQVLFHGEKPFPVLAACEHYAGSEKMVLKALALQSARGGGFDVTVDLEDGAADGREAEHAAMAASLIASPANALRRTGVRIHPHHHPSWRADVDAVVAAKPAYITVPKARSLGEVREVMGYIHSKLAVPIHVLIETHGALRDAFAIAALDGVEVLDFGLMDFISDHHGAIPETCMRSPGQFEHALIVRAKTEIVAAALASGVVPSHNVTLALKDREQTYADAHRARVQLGFLRMWSIHPEQIEPIIDAMKPDFSAVEHAGLILLAAQERNWAPIEHAGKLHDRASYRWYWELLQRAHLAGTTLDPAVHAAFFAV